MFDFLKSLFNPAPPSSNTAKERLRLVLLSDHLSLSPETVQALKADLLAVISRYVEIDSSHADVTFEHRENEVAMLANIPITGVRERKRAVEENAAPKNVPSIATATPSVAEVAPSDAQPARDSATAASAIGAAAPSQAALDLHAEPPLAEPVVPAESAGPAVGPHVPRRRRRRKSGANAATRPQPPQAYGNPAQA